MRRKPRVHTVPTVYYVATMRTPTFRGRYVSAQVGCTRGLNDLLPRPYWQTGLYRGHWVRRVHLPFASLALVSATDWREPAAFTADRWLGPT